MNTSGLLLIFGLSAAGCAQSVGTFGDADGGLTAAGGVPPWTLGGAKGVDGSSAASAGGGSGGTTFDPPACSLPTPDSECRTAPLCGCGAGENCVIADPASGRSVCIAAGTAAVDEPCADLGSCIAGATCIDSTCKPYCASDVDCTQKCVGTLYQGNSVPGLSTCTSGCALDDPASCGPGIGCFLLSDGLSDCRPAGTSATSCSGVQDCASGYACLDDGSCAAWCRPGGASCAVGSCQTGDGSTVVDGIVYGLCF
jgi:hypothetical protein